MGRDADLKVSIWQICKVIAKAKATGLPPLQIFQNKLSSNIQKPDLFKVKLFSLVPMLVCVHICYVATIRGSPQMLTILHTMQGKKNVYFQALLQLNSNTIIILL